MHAGSNTKLLMSISFALWCAALTSDAFSQHQDILSPPNILWITSEDNSPFLGCYGDQFATTPHLDQLASKGFLYTHAYANAPVCAPTRNTIITGVYANSGGHENMRSSYRRSEIVRLYPEYLRQAGYYCTNAQKEDFNIDPTQTRAVWDELGKDAHYRNRPKGKPFFAIFNSTITHESSIHNSTPDSLLRHRPDQVKLPPYHPDTPEMRHDWAQYYDKIEDMDAWVGKILKELEESGEASNTIVFYYGDHGGVLGRSKRFLYESGTRVPFIVHIPEKYKHLYPTDKPGSRIERPISFVDLVPTLLSLIEAPIPSHLQGNAFLGKWKSEDPEYVFMFRGRMDERYDLSRAVRDSRFRYIRNYMPHRIYGQHIDYLFRAPSLRSWEQACKTGDCNEIQQKFWNTKPAEELYDTENDPWEVQNLAENPEYQPVLNRMRAANKAWLLEIKDPGFIPEAALSSLTGGSSAYDYMRSGQIDLNAIIEAAEYASSANPKTEKLRTYLQSENPAIRYWGATGFLILGKQARDIEKDLLLATKDTVANVVIVAAEALYKLEKPAEARVALVRSIKSGNDFARTHALNVVDYVDDKSPEIQQAVIGMVKAEGEFKPDRYDLRMARTLLDKWKIRPEDVGIRIKW